MPLLLEVLPHVADVVPASDSFVAPCVQVMTQLEPVALDEHVAPPAASVPQRHSDVPPEVTVQHAEDDVVLDEHPSGTASATTPTTARTQPATIDHTCRMLLLTLAIPRTSPRGLPAPLRLYGTGSDVTPFFLASSHPSSTPVGPSFVLTILNSTRRFCSHAASLWPGSSGQNSP